VTARSLRSSVPRFFVDARPIQRFRTCRNGLPKKISGLTRRRWVFPGPRSQFGDAGFVSSPAFLDRHGLCFAVAVARES
jgi:hypothetical protein